MIRITVAGELPALARRLRDLGAEVVYTGLSEPAGIAVAAVQDDVDAVVCADPAEVAAHLARLGAADIAVLSAADAPGWLATGGERSHDRG